MVCCGASALPIDRLGLDRQFLWLVWEVASLEEWSVEGHVVVALLRMVASPYDPLTVVVVPMEVVAEPLTVVVGTLRVVDVGGPKNSLVRVVLLADCSLCSAVFLGRVTV